MCDYCKENYLNKNMSTDKYCEITIIDNDIEIDYEEDFVNTVNRISPNELHYNKNFIDYIRLHHKLSTSEIETIYSKLIQAKVKQEVRV